MYITCVCEYRNSIYYVENIDKVARHLGNTWFEPLFCVQKFSHLTKTDEFLQLVNALTLY